MTSNPDKVSVSIASLSGATIKETTLHGEASLSDLQKFVLHECKPGWKDVICLSDDGVASTLSGVYNNSV